MGTAIAGVI